MKKVLLIRVDKIGDLVLSLELDQHPLLKDCEAQWLVSAGLEPILDSALPPRKAHFLSKSWSISNFIQLIQTLKALRPDISVNLYSPWWINFALWWARVPVRIGRLSHWSSFLFLNFGIRQSRSKSEMHESDYNHELLQKGFLKANLCSKEIEADSLSLERREYLKMVPLGDQKNSKILSLGLEPKKYIVIHPGMAGSAKNWDQESYVALIKKLIPNQPIVITGTDADEPYLTKIRSALSRESQVHWLTGQLAFEELFIVLSEAKALLAPSTGVLHLGASLGTPCLGLYSPIEAQSVNRWGPRGPAVRTLTGKVDSAQDALVFDLDEVFNELNRISQNSALQ